MTCGVDPTKAVDASLRRHDGDDTGRYAQESASTAAGVISTAARAIMLIIGGVRIKIYHRVARVDGGISLEDVAIFRFWNE